MSKWRRLHIISQILILGCAASAHGEVEDCGQILRAPIPGDIIYVLCPSLPNLSEQQAKSIVWAVLDMTSRRAGDTRIFFLSDRSVLDRDRQYQDMGKRIESWGDVFVGAYHTNSNLLTVRSASESRWRNIYIPYR